jgi:predicted nucleic acid-binding Zn ribbon protein
MSAASLWEQFSHDPRQPEHGRLRASDRDRDVISDVLGTAYAEGRLTPAELDERSDAVAQARTLSELPAIIDDLVAPSPATPHLVPSSSAHREVAERRYRRLRLVTQIIFLVPTLICWVVWLSLRLNGVDTFAWPIFPTLGTSIPLVVVVASRKEIIAGSEARLARREQRAMQRFQSRSAPRPLGPPSGPQSLPPGERPGT